MRLNYPTNIKIVRVPCTGKVDVIHLLRASFLGALLVDSDETRRWRLVAEFLEEYRWEPAEMRADLLERVGLEADRPGRQAQIQLGEEGLLSIPNRHYVQSLDLHVAVGHAERRSRRRCRHRGRRTRRPRGRGRRLVVSSRYDLRRRQRRDQEVPGLLAVGLVVFVLAVAEAAVRYTPSTWIQRDGRFYTNVNVTLVEDGSVSWGSTLIVNGRLGYRWSKRSWAPMPASLEGRTAVVTGATAGLGRIVAEDLAALGARVICVGRDPQKLERVRQEIIAAPARQTASPLKTAAATIAYFLSLQRDAVGLLTFDEQIAEHLPARFRPGHLHRLMLCLERSLSGKATDLRRCGRHEHRIDQPDDRRVIVTLEQIGRLLQLLRNLQQVHLVVETADHLHRHLAAVFVGFLQQAVEDFDRYS